MKIKTQNLTGKQWIERLEKGGYNVGSYAKQLLLSKDFKPTEREFEIAVVSASDVGESSTTKEIIRYAKKKGFELLPADAAPVIREMYSNEKIEEMGLLYIVVMHEPIKDSDGSPLLLVAGRYGDGRWLGAFCDNPGIRWGREVGFAFAVSQVNKDIILPETLTINGVVYKKQ